MLHHRVLSAVLQEPWAITDDKFNAIVAVLARREANERMTAADIELAIGERREERQPYCLDETGTRHEFLYAASAVAAHTGSKPAQRRVIAVLPVYGIIGPKASAFSDVSGPGGTGIDSLTSQFRSAMANDEVRTIVLDFDSPGGSVYGVDELAAEIFAAREQKRIVAQINPFCASAAYYLASQCTEIAITSSGEVGSIGVRMMHTDLSKALEMKGVKITNIAAGKYKTEGSNDQPLDPEARDFMQSRVDDYYAMFTKAVARGREVKAGDVREGFGQGRMVGATEAKKLGMIDRFATLDQTLARLGGDVSQKTSMQAGGEVPAAQIPNVPPPATADSKEDSMEPNTTAAVAADATAAARNAFAAETTRCEEISALAREHGMTAKLGAWLKDGATIDAVRAQILTDLRTNVRPIEVASAEATPVRIVKDEADKTPGFVSICRMARMLAYAKGDRTAAAARAKQLGDGIVASALMAAPPPQVASSLSAGGAWVPENFVPDMIEFLRPLAVFRAMNPAGYPLVNGNLSLPKLTGGGSASYVGETGPIPVSKAVTGQVKFSAKKLAAIIPISNDLIRYAGLSVDAALRDDMGLALSQAEDGAFLRGEGSQFSPKGLLFQAAAGGILQSTIAKAALDAPTNSLTIITAIQNDIASMFAYLAANNVRMLRPGFVMSRRSEIFLKYQVRDGLGNQVYRAEMEAGKFFGYPYRATTVIPNNLSVVGSGIDSEIYLADFADVVLCDSPTIAIEVSNEATYVDSLGTSHNAFQEDSTLVRFIEEHDLNVRHNESVVVLTGVEYGT